MRFTRSTWHLCYECFNRFYAVNGNRKYCSVDCREKAQKNRLAKKKESKMSKNMITEGSIKLPNGDTVSVGHGGYYGICGDRYPVTIAGWSKSGKTIYYQFATKIPTHDCKMRGKQTYLFQPNPEAEIKKATWRRNESCFVPAGTTSGGVFTGGYEGFINPDS